VLLFSFKHSLPYHLVLFRFGYYRSDWIRLLLFYKIHNRRKKIPIRIGQEEELIKYLAATQKQKEAPLSPLLTQSLPSLSSLSVTSGYGWIGIQATSSTWSKKEIWSEDQQST